MLIAPELGVMASLTSCNVLKNNLDVAAARLLVDTVKDKDISLCGITPEQTEFVGQDLIAQRKDEGYDSGGSADCGYSSDTVLCLMDPREFANHCAYFTRQIRRLNGDLPRSRTVDTAIRRSSKNKRGGIETSLIQF